MSVIKNLIRVYELFIKFVDKYGVFKLIMSSIIMVFLSYAAYITMHPEVMFEKYSQYEIEKHSKSFAYRMESTPVVQTNLDKLVLESDANRAFIIELHNGKYNSAGLSFNYGSLTYESLDDSIESIKEDYDDFTIERFPMTLKVYNEGSWYGNIDNLENIDKRLALRMRSNGTEYLCVTTIYGTADVIGFLGVTYSEKEGPTNLSKVKRLLTKYSSTISPLLDGAKVNEK